MSETTKGTKGTNGTTKKAASRRDEGTVFVCSVSTECFEFCAIGRTAREAEMAFVRKFNELAPERQTLAQLKDWYGVNTTEMRFGECTRL